MQRLMRPLILALLCATLLACDSTNTNSTAVNSNANASAALTTPTPSKPDLGQALSTPASNPEERVKATDAYVADIETKLPGLTRKERILKPDQLKGTTEADLEKLHAYFDGQTLKRIKTYPKGNSPKTEEFYFHDDKLVFVFVESEGKGKEGDAPGAKGEKLYFDSSGLVAWFGEDGKPKDSASGAFKTKGDKMLVEAVAFRQLSR